MDWVYQASAISALLLHVSEWLYSWSLIDSNATHTICDDWPKQANDQSIYVLTGHMSGHFWQTISNTTAACIHLHAMETENFWGWKISWIRRTLQFRRKKLSRDAVLKIAGGHRSISDQIACVTAQLALLLVICSDHCVNIGCKYYRYEI